MSFQDRLKGILGGESVENDLVVVSPEDHAIVVADNEVVVAAAEVAELEEEISQQENDIATLEERVEDLEEEVAGLESMFSGASDWNPGLAQKLYNNARRISTRTFGEDSDLSIKGAECFSDVSTAQMELIAGVEAMKDRAKTMWEGVKQFFINLYNSVTAFFVSLFDRLRGLEKKADAISTKLNATADDKIKKTIKLGKWNAFVNAEKGKDHLGDLKKVSSALAGIGSSLSSQTVDGIESALNKSGLDIVAAADSKKEGNSNENTTQTTGAIGGVHFTVTYPKSSPKDAVAALKGTNISYNIAKEAGVRTEGELATNKGKSFLSGVVKGCKVAAQAARISKFDASALKVARDKAIAQVESAGGEGDAVKAKVAGIRAGNAAALKFGRVLTNFQADSISAHLAFVSAHV